MRVYYNEWDAFAAAWLRELMRAGLIPDGYIDERSILDVRAADLDGYDQCHFFAGIGGWALAFRLAGIEVKKGYWSASLPCQPLSGAGKQRGHADERHLWPAFYELVAQCRPAKIFGEQVASELGREWFSGIRPDLEELGHACGAADLCAAGIGAPHIRQRIFWVSYPTIQGRGSRRHAGADTGAPAESGRLRAIDGVADTSEIGRRSWGRQQSGSAGIAVIDGDSSPGSVADPRQQPIRSGQSRSVEIAQGTIEEDFGERQWIRPDVGDGSTSSSVADTDTTGTARLGEHGGGIAPQKGVRRRSRPGRSTGRLGDAEGQGLPIGTRINGDDGASGPAYPRQGFEQTSTVPILCSDGKWRRIPANESGQPEPQIQSVADDGSLGKAMGGSGRESGSKEIDPYLFPLAPHGTVKNRVGILRGSGNAIVPLLAARFITAAEEAIQDVAVK